LFDKRNRLFCEQLDPRIRQQVETKLIEPYKGLFDISALSMAANVLMYSVSFLISFEFSTLNRSIAVVHWFNVTVIFIIVDVLVGVFA